MTEPFQFGIEHLPPSLTMLRTGLAAHAASRTVTGEPSWEFLSRQSGYALTALFGPEHGFRGKAGAGEKVADARLGEAGPVIYSLYGETRKPTQAMLRDLDLIVLDFQDLAVRCYTYVSTLDLVLEAASEKGLKVIVADRPVPLANCLDGPMLDPACKSFVGQVPSPLVYGMTQGETARWLKQERGYTCPLEILSCTGWTRSSACPVPATWIPPSPAIRSWHTAWTYPMLVFVEAFPFLDAARSTDKAFTVLRGRDLRAAEILDRLQPSDLPGITAQLAEQGLAFCVDAPDNVRPVSAAVALLSALQQVHGKDWLWAAPDSRPEFFDKLMGTASVREMLLDDVPALEISKGWKKPLEAFGARRKEFLLYA